MGYEWPPLLVFLWCRPLVLLWCWFTKKRERDLFTAVSSSLLEGPSVNKESPSPSDPLAAAPGNPMEAFAVALAVLLFVAGLVPLLNRLARFRRRARAAAITVPSPCARRSVFVIVNPHAGSGEGRIVYEDVVKPMLDRAGVLHAVAFTARPGHARSICEEVVTGRHNLDDVPFDCIVSVSGDGLLHECLNGVMNTKPRIALAIVPAGSGNGVAETLYGRGSDAVAAMRAILSGAPRAVDVLAMKPVSPAAGRMPTYDVHFFCWAVFADHDHLVEGPLRWIGPLAKLALAPLIVIARRRCYPGVIDFRPRPAPADLPTARAGAYADASELPRSPADPAMRRLEGSFWCLALGNMAESGGSNSPTPDVRSHEGAADLLVCWDRPTLSRWRCLSLFLQMETRQHVFAPEVQIFKTDSVVLWPRGRGHLQLSGQEMPMPPSKEEPVCISVLDGAATLVY